MAWIGYSGKELENNYMKNFLKLSSLLIYTGRFMQYVTIDYEKYKYLFGSHKTRYF